MYKKILAVCLMVFIPGLVHAFGFEHKTTHVLENSVGVTSGVHDVITHGDYLYIVLGREYAPDVHTKESLGMCDKSDKL